MPMSWVSSVQARKKATNIWCFSTAVPVRYAISDTATNYSPCTDTNSLIQSMPVYYHNRVNQLSPVESTYSAIFINILVGLVLSTSPCPQSKSFCNDWPCSINKPNCESVSITTISNRQFTTTQHVMKQFLHDQCLFSSILRSSVGHRIQQ